MRYFSIAVLLCLASVPAVWADDAELAGLRRENADLRSEVEALRTRVAALEAQVDAARAQAESVAAQRRALARDRQAVAAQRKVVEAERLAQQETAVSVSREGGRVSVRGRWTPLEVTHGLRRGQQWRFTAQGGGGASPTVMWTLRSAMSGGIYRGVKTLHLDVDGRSVEAAVIDYDSKIRAGGGRRRGRRDEETVNGVIRFEDLTAVVASTETTGRLGTVRFRITEEQRIILRALVNATRQVPGVSVTHTAQE